MPPPTPSFFLSTDPPTTEIYTLSLHDALPILHHDAARAGQCSQKQSLAAEDCGLDAAHHLDVVAHRFVESHDTRSEEHTSELQSRLHLVCRLLLEKKKKKKNLFAHRCMR